MLACFGALIAADRAERNHRFYEEATELVQSGGMSREDAHALVDYTFDRPIGEPKQEVGGTMVTLAAWCLAHDINMHECADAELKRINVPEMIEKIRAKQLAKPKFGPLAAHPPTHQKQALALALEFVGICWDALDNSEEMHSGELRVPIEYVPPINAVFEKFDTLPNDRPDYVLDGQALISWHLRNLVGASA